MTEASLERAIWRLRLDRVSNQLVQLPPGSRILSVQLRDGTDDQLDLWAEVTPTDPPRVMFYTVRLVGTGDRVPTPYGVMRYVSTVQLWGGEVVFHVYATSVQPGEALPS